MNILRDGIAYILYEKDKRTVFMILCLSNDLKDERIELVPGQYIDVYLGNDAWAEMYYAPDRENQLICVSRFRKEGEDTGFFALAHGSRIRVYDAKYPYVSPVSDESSFELKKEDFEKDAEAKALRAICLEIAYTVSCLLYEQRRDRLSLTAYLERLDALLVERGIFVGMHTQTPLERYADPLVAAQKVASQWKDVLGKTIRTFSETNAILQEFTERSFTVDGQNIVALYGNDLHPQIRDFALLRSYINLTYIALDARENEKRKA